jgi:MtN3 and saliva related transmembrane protein
LNLFIDFFGSLALITSIVGLMPQVCKMARTKSAKDVSMIMLINYLICSLAWIFYGFFTDSKFVVLSNIAGLVTSLVLIWQKIRYDRKKNI